MGVNEMCSEETNPTHDQVPIRAILIRQGEVQQEQQLSGWIESWSLKEKRGTV
jgi:hypothetical protein